RRPETPHYLVGDRVPLPAVEGVAEGTTVRKPDGSAVPLSPGAKFFEGTERPGVYTLERAGGGAEFAVNLDPRESLTSPTAVESLEQMGCRLAGRAPRGDEAERLRQMRDIELEGRQKVWRWLVLAVIGVLLAETWLAGRRSRARPAGAEAVKP
ncbi:MAG TPA: hypothetical protein VIL46_08785, partial [Gemmataceae bacterium]